MDKQFTASVSELMGEFPLVAVSRSDQSIYGAKRLCVFICVLNRVCDLWEAAMSLGYLIYSG